jgi:hypothetical protein
LTTVALLFSIVYFTLAALPLLILKHDTPRDSSFVRGVLNTNYVAVIIAALVCTLSYALAVQPAISFGMAGIAAFAFAVRNGVISRMDRLRSTMTVGDSAAIAQFRRLHITGIVLNVVPLGPIAWVMTHLDF